MFSRIKNWWIGEEYYLENVIPGVRYKHHWTAKIAHTLVNFYLEHWKWLWGILLTISSLIVAYLKL